MVSLIKEKLAVRVLGVTALLVLLLIPPPGTVTSTFILVLESCNCKTISFCHISFPILFVPGEGSFLDIRGLK